MSFRHDRRGQSVVVGTVILFGFLILAMATYQVQFVPAENEEIEFEHSQQVEGEFLDLRNAILQAGSTGSVQSEPIQLGTRYPQRTFFLNPPPASGSLQTTGEEAIQVNATVGSGAHENVREFWTQTDPRFNTTSIRYTPDYNEYRGAPRLLYEHSVVAAEFDDAVLLRSDQTVVRGDRIAITALTGAISETGVESQSVDPEPISRSSRTVPITGDGGDVEIVLPTAVDNATALRGRWAAELPNATVTEDGGTVRIALNGSETYRLGLSKVAVDAGGTTEPAYVVPVTGNGTVGESVGVEVRDKYNNPVVGAEVSLDGTTENTNADGRAFFEPDAADDYSATINGGSESYESVPFTITEAGGNGSVNRTFNTEWDLDSATVVENDERDLNVSVSDRSGTPIANATIDYSITPQSPNGSLSKWNQSVHDGTDNVTFEAGSAQQNESFDVYASAGDDVDRTEVTVIGGTVDLQDEIFESDSNFTVDHELTNLDSGYLVVENEDTGGTYENTVGDGSTTVDAADIGGISDGDTINATLYQDGSMTTELANDIETVGTVSPTFSVDITSTNAPVTEGENLDVEVTVENTGGSTGTQNIRFLVDGEEINVRGVTLASGAQVTESFTYQTEQGDSPDVDVRAESDDDFDTRTATVNAPAQFEVGITSTNEPITEGEDLNVDYTVENTGDETDTQTIELLDFDDQVIDSIEVTLDGGETTSGTLTWSTTPGDAETDDITVRSEDDTAVQGVTIDPTMASQVSGVDGTVGQSNIPGGGRAVEFDISADQSVEIDAFSVETQNDMSGRTFSDTGSSFDGQSLPATINGQATVELREFSGSGSLGIDENFVSDSSSADIIVTLEFSDGSELSLNIT
ncbi:CARDB domain-containing protein [Halorubrum aethiopicum]|uniref:CARDB domain-containing protein n=1 Tax=Halorubrum aethiopicum TaxID=1758255 RepID=UPI00082F97F2|nr:CARDB domain-containing protein [Halorubrum aethiopicum]